MSSALLAAILIGTALPSATFAVDVPAEAPPPHPGAPAGGPDDGSDPSTFSQVPPGTPEDQALWKAAGDVDVAVPLAKQKMAALQWTIRNERLDERLGEMGSGEPPKAARAREVRARLGSLAVAAYAILTRLWPVDTTRVCSYARMTFATAMGTKDGPEKAGQLGPARGELQDCLSKARTTLQVVNQSNDDLAAAVADALGLVGPLPAGKAPPRPPDRPPPGASVTVPAPATSAEGGKAMGENTR